MSINVSEKRIEIEKNIFLIKAGSEENEEKSLRSVQ